MKIKMSQKLYQPISSSVFELINYQPGSTLTYILDKPQTIYLHASFQIQIPYYPNVITITFNSSSETLHLQDHTNTIRLFTDGDHVKLCKNTSGYLEGTIGMKWGSQTVNIPVSESVYYKQLTKGCSKHKILNATVSLVTTGGTSLSHECIEWVIPKGQKVKAWWNHAGTPPISSSSLKQCQSNIPVVVANPDMWYAIGGVLAVAGIGVWLWSQYKKETMYRIIAVVSLVAGGSSLAVGLFESFKEHEDNNK